MPSQTRSAGGGDELLSFTDQALFLGMRATGQEPVMQCVWVYEHPVDFDAVKRFHQNLGYGLLGRRIETSPLPFGRHRWVSSPGAPTEIDHAEQSRPRAELSDWADERVQLPIDPENGPGWHLGVLPMTDGSTAISLVASHCLMDGVGGALTIINAVQGITPDLGFAQPGSRTRFRALVSDARQALLGLPEVLRTIGAVAALAVRRRHEIGQSGRRRPTATNVVDADDVGIVVPAISIFVDVAMWDARAEALGGNSYSLLAGFAARLAERLGRGNAEDGTVTLFVPTSDRTDERDTRANAAVVAKVVVDPSGVTTDLSAARADLKKAFAVSREVPDETLLILPLIPYIPEFAVKTIADVVLGAAELPVSCSNVGDLPALLGQCDGTDADYVYVRGVDRHFPRHILERRGGQLTLVSGRLGGKVSISVVAYRPGVENSKPLLRELAVKTLAEFDLTGLID